MARKRITSVDREREVEQDALLDLEPPESAGELDEAALNMFHMLSRAKAKSDWFEHEVYMIARLAKVMVRLQGLEEELEVPGAATQAHPRSGTESPSGLAREVDSLRVHVKHTMNRLNLSSSKMKREQIRPRAEKERDARSRASDTAKASLFAVQK